MAARRSGAAGRGRRRGAPPKDRRPCAGGEEQGHVVVDTMFLPRLLVLDSCLTLLGSVAFFLFSRRVVVDCGCWG